MDVLFKRIIALVAALAASVSFIAVLYVGFSSTRKQKVLNDLREFDAAIHELELSPNGTQRSFFVSLDEGVVVYSSPDPEEQTFNVGAFNIGAQGQNVWIIWQDGGATKLSPTDYRVSMFFAAPVRGPGFFEFVLTRGAGDVVGVHVSEIAA